MPNDDTHSPNYILLLVGIVLLLIPLGFVIFAQEFFKGAEFYLRVIAALGGALVGTSLPGILHVNLPFARAGGALGVFLLIFYVNPPQLTNQKLDKLGQDETVTETDSNNSRPASPTSITPAQPAQSSNSLTSVSATQRQQLSPSTLGKKGWIYVGHHPNDEWGYRTIAIDMYDELRSGKHYKVSVELNVRSRPPKFTFTGYNFGKVLHTLKPGHMIKFTGNSDEVGLSKVWAEVEY